MPARQAAPAPPPRRPNAVSDPAPARPASPEPEAADAPDPGTDTDTGTGAGTGTGAPEEPSDLLKIDDLLESVDFDEPARAYPGTGRRSRISARRAPRATPTESSITGTSHPLSAWPMGAG
ncbi:MAG TPA: hypothetical protein VHS52_02955 [Acidimicrobiales bacterium]|nr:hypothetical protein [Acidimicrobiales bacterium]